MNVTIPYIAGYEESGFLTGLGIELQDIQVLANGATEVDWNYDNQILRMS